MIDEARSGVIKKPHTKIKHTFFRYLSSFKQTKMLKQLIKKERRIFNSSDDSAITKQVLATHLPDGREVDLDLLLSVIEETFHHSVPADIDAVVNGTDSGNIHELAHEEKALLGFDDITGVPDGLASIIHKISCEFSCQCSGGADAHASTLAILNMLSSYTWEAKVVIALASFAVIFGEFWLVAQLYSTNPLAKSVALLKHMPNVIEHYKSLKTRFDAINLLIKGMLDVTKCFITLKNLPHQYIQDDQPPKSTATPHIPTATYWSIKSMVACSSQLTSLLGMNYDRYITATSEAWELSSLAHKVHNIHEHLKSILVLCYQDIEEKQHNEYHLMLVRIFESTTHVDNVKILKALFCAKDDVHPLYHGSSKTRINVDVLRKTNVLLLISDLEITHEEIITLTQIYKHSRTISDLNYEIVWVPVVDTLTWNESQQHKLEQLQSMMTWHMIHHPNLLEPAVIKYIKETWKFEKKTILVTLDQKGKVQSTNALHMMWIWRNRAYPFSTTQEESLWKEESWTLRLLVDNIDERIVQWISEERYICLYGGDDMEWIKTFTKSAKDISTSAGINFEMVYVGKSGRKEKITKICKAISEEGISHTWVDPTSVWYFWTRLESMLYSRTQYGKSIENDAILKEVLTMMGFDGSDQGWALISRGSTEMARANAETALTTLTEFEKWEGSVQANGFVVALKGHLESNQTPHHCNRLILPGISGEIPDVVVCSECGRQMEKFYMFRCCTD
ncbi:hypothetical protein L1887_26137 [Cichorium endivia]|nr:hypothetical protein L1887_26137 [Cichorium endivia]